MAFLLNIVSEKLVREISKENIRFWLQEYLRSIQRLVTISKHCHLKCLDSSDNHWNKNDGENFCTHDAICYVLILIYY